jgi:hypothetical protein
MATDQWPPWLTKRKNNQRGLGGGKSGGSYNTRHQNRSTYKEEGKIKRAIKSIFTPDKVCGPHGCGNRRKIERLKNKKLKQQGYNKRQRKSIVESNQKRTEEYIGGKGLNVGIPGLGINITASYEPTQQNYGENIVSTEGNEIYTKQAYKQNKKNEAKAKREAKFEIDIFKKGKKKSKKEVDKDTVRHIPVPKGGF